MGQKYSFFAFFTTFDGPLSESCALRLLAFVLDIDDEFDDCFIAEDDEIDDGLIAKDDEIDGDDTIEARGMDNWVRLGLFKDLVPLLPLTVVMFGQLEMAAKIFSAAESFSEASLIYFRFFVGNSR